MDKRYQKVNFKAIPFGKRQNIYQVVKIMMTDEKPLKLLEIRRKNLEISCEAHSQQAELAAIYGCEPGYISNMINGRKTIGEKTARKLEKCLNKPVYWIDTPQLERYKNDSIQIGVVIESSVIEAAKEYKHYPRVVGTARCGDEGYYMDLEGGGGYIEMESKAGSIAVRIKGHSMHPAIKEDWFVVIEPDKPPVLGEYVLVKFADGRKMVKELLQIKSDGYLLLSVNSNERITANHTDIEGIEAIAAIVPPSKHKEW